MKIAAVLALFLSGATCYQPVGRRDLLKAASSVAVLGLADPVFAVGPSCPKGSNNCLTEVWTAPSATQVSDLKDILNSYPQEGQNGVDKGGYAIVSLDSSGGHIEYKSGVGNFAKFLNGGKPFVDDLDIVIEDATVYIKSASRIGDSDLGVNQKRLQFLANAARSKGWDAPEPKY